MCLKIFNRNFIYVQNVRVVFPTDFDFGPGGGNKLIIGNIFMKNYGAREYEGRKKVEKKTYFSF